jgi:nucleoside-diphosphate-sugar epimerase
MDLSAAAADRIDEAAAQREAAAAAPANYGGNKLKCEAALAAAGTGAAQLRSTVVRPPAVVGAGCDTRHERLHRHVAELPPLPSPAKLRPPALQPGRRFRVACADDVAALITTLVDRRPTAPAEAFNVASGDAHGVTLDEYATAIASALGVAHAPPLPDDPAMRNCAATATHRPVTRTAAARHGSAVVPGCPWVFSSLRAL